MASSGKEDLDLARRIARGDEDAAAGFVHQISPEMFGYARKILGEVAAAEDALQEALLGMLKSIERFDGRVSLRAWGFGILRHKIHDILRRRGRDFAFSSDDPEAENFRPDGSWKEDVTFGVWDENKELLQIVMECLEKLPHGQRAALELRALEGLSAAEAAEILGVSPTNLRQILHRGRAAVRRCADQRAGEKA